MPNSLAPPCGYEGGSIEHERSGRCITAVLRLAEGAVELQLSARTAWELAAQMEEQWGVCVTKSTLNRHAKSGKLLCGCVSVRESAH